jgi:2-succinyl-6-hydroxy-2,4-cyclohexadiene-1-carboxylate synthase
VTPRRVARIERDGVALAYEVTGAASLGRRCLVFIHGLGDSVRLWDETLALLPSPTALAVDLRGHGASGVPLAPEAYSMAHFVADLEAVLNQAGVDAALLVGFSLGGAVALHFGLAHPDRVAGILAINANAAARDPEEESELERAAAGGSSGTALRSERERRWAAKLVERLAPGPRLASAAGRSASVLPRAGEFAMPVWLIASDRDPGFVARSEVLLRHLRHGRRRVIAGAGHAVMRDQPAQLAAAIAEFAASA